ncbi:rhodanese-like domain-containing protein [Pseudonocardia sp. KRD291]|uniref:rhodanese-like domain-containing protein n=1 Tax=Pseudonocardia sp. KRD291 TaxID=2792007 RepID=UPI0027E2F24F|nr:rhodanese-like domain-containing protein [Pseudonocardia sp. KRD291]
MALAALLAVLLAGCGAGQTPPADPTRQETGASSTPQTASRLLEPAAFAAAVAEPTRTTINVHVPFEGAIEGTDIDVPFDRIATDAARLPTNRTTSLAIYCKSGRMSAIAATELARLGYRDVVELRGGMDAWRQQGFALLTTPSTPAG